MGNKFIVDGKVSRSKIVREIKERGLKKDGIETLVRNPKISNDFIGTSYSGKRPKNEWNKSYLDKLSFASVGESFNRDYLLYLDEVAGFVTKASFKKIIVMGVIVVLVIIAGIIVFINILNGGKT